jgi:hypothetical protein
MKWKKLGTARVRVIEKNGKKYVQVKDKGKKRVRSVCFGKLSKKR